MRRKLVITNGAGEYPAAENSSSAITSPDPPPYLSRFSQISDSMLKRGSAKSTDRKVRDPTISRVTGPSSIASSLEDSRLIKSPSVSKTRLLEKVGSVKVPVTLAKPNELQVKTANATQISMGNESKNSSRIQPVPQLGIAHTHVENKINPTTHASSHSPRAKTPPSTFSASRDASLSENISLKPNIGRVSHMQTHAKVSLPGDSSELEARTVAKSVMSMSASTWSPEWEAPAMRNTVQIPTLGGGFPLSTRIRSFMEPRFQQDLGHVRIHTGEQADRLCSDLRARAFTVGSHIFFGKDEFQPSSQNGLELIAHELTHTFQQGTTVRRSEEANSDESGGSTFGFGWVLDIIAEKANVIPGFRMFTIILGKNPINMSDVDRSPANILRAMVEFMPGGSLITKALDNYGIIDKVANWVTKQIETLSYTAGSIKQAITRFISGLSLAHPPTPSEAWDQVKAIFTEPIDRIKEFAKNLAADVIKFIKDAILVPLAQLASSKVECWDLLVGVLGYNPLTNEEVSASPEVLIGGFMKLIGQQEIWENMQKANAVDRAWKWFQSTMGTLMNFVEQIPGLAMKAFEELEIEDIVLVVTAFEKIGRVFGGFLSNFTSWALDAMWKLLEIIFEVVKPGALEYVKKTGAAIKGILQDPMPFVGNLVKAAKLGFENFADHFVEHLKNGLISWLTDSLPGVYIPQALTLPELVKLAFSVLGISWQLLRQKLVKVVGDETVKAMEVAIPIVVTLVTEGPAAAWDKIKEELANLRDMVLGGIIDLVVDAVVQKAIPKLIAMFVPGAGFISAIISIYDTVMVFVNKLSQIGQVVVGFINSIVAIASGDIGGAASKVESILANVLSLAINFLAGFAGLGKVADKVLKVVEKVRTLVDKGLDKLADWIVKMAKKLFAKVFGKKEGETDNNKSSKKSVKTQKDLSMHGASHTIYAEYVDGNVTITMASGRLDVLRSSVAGAIQQEKHGANRQPLIALLNNILIDLKTAQEDLAAAIVNSEGELETRLLQKISAIAETLIAIGNNFGLTDLIDLGHPSKYVKDDEILPEYRGDKFRPMFYGTWNSTAESYRRTQLAMLKQEAKDPKWSTEKLFGNPNAFVVRDRKGGWTPYLDDASMPNNTPLDHVDDVSTHWNSGAAGYAAGNDSEQPHREKFYNDIANLQVINQRENSRKGGAPRDYRVGKKFRGPGE